MATNDNTNPATQNDQTIAGTTDDDTLTGGYGSDTITGGDGSDVLIGDDAPTSGWLFEFFTQDFGLADGQAFTIENGTQAASGYVTDLDAVQLVTGGAAVDPDDFGLVYTSTLNITQGGTYTFDLTSDDGSTIQIFDSSGNIVQFTDDGTGAPGDYLNNDFLQAATTRTGTIELDPNETYTIQVRFWENDGSEVLSATISGPDTGGVPEDLGTSDLIGQPPGPEFSVTGTALGAPGNDSLDGGAGDDSLIGGEGNDTLTGGAGDDTLNGGAGADVLEGGGGLDIADYSGSDAAVSVDLRTFSVSGGHATGDVLSGIDGVTGSDFDDTIVGFDAEFLTGSADDFTNVIDGGAGNDLIFGLGGRDTLLGGEGNDTIVGGAGADVVFGDAGDDALFGGAGDDTIEGGAGNDQISDDENLLVNGALEAGVTDGDFNGAGNPAGWTNSAGGIEVWGDGHSGVSSTDGGNFVELDNSAAGIDNLFQDVATEVGESYSLTFDAAVRPGSEGDAVEVYWNGVLQGVVVPGSAAFETFTFDVIGTGGLDRLEFREPAGESNALGPYLDNISLVNNSDDNFSGDEGNDTIFAGGGQDTLSGGADDDSLDAGAGNDSLSGGTGNDTLTGGIGNDTLTGGDGNDTFVYAPGDGDDVITDFNAGNSGTTSDGDQTNNDFIDLSAYYTHIHELRADLSDNGVLDQSVGDFSDNIALGGSISLTGVTGNDLTFDNTNVACFTAGTLIDTVDGPVPVEKLHRGMRLRTWDNGNRPVRAVLRRKVDGSGDLAPIHISAGALDNTRDLIVSPAHRMLISDWRAQMLFGADEVLVSAANLVRGDLIFRAPVKYVTYFHILMDRHEVIFAEGAATESYHLTRDAADAAEFGDSEDGAVALEIARLFPELLMCASRCVRPVMKGYEAKALAGMLG